MGRMCTVQRGKSVDFVKKPTSFLRVQGVLQRLSMLLDLFLEKMWSRKTRCRGCGGFDQSEWISYEWDMYIEDVCLFDTENLGLTT